MSKICWVILKNKLQTVLRTIKILNFNTLQFSQPQRAIFSIKNTKFLFFFIFTMGSGLLFSQVKIQVDTTHIRIGEQIIYEISTANTSPVLFPVLKLDSLKKIEIVGDLPIDTLKNRLYKKYLLTGFDSGSYVIPAQEVLINNQRFLTDSILIQVGTVAVDTIKQGLFPLKPIYKAPPKTWHEYLWILWWLLVILIVIAMVWWFAFKGKKIIQFKPKKILTPFDIALTQLKALDEKDLIGQQKIKEYYTELTDIVRNYIEKDLKITAMEVTSDELVTLLKKTNKYKKLGISREQINHLELFLHNSDLVKFAKGKPETETINNDRSFAETVLKELKTVVSKPETDSEGNSLQEMEAEEIIIKTNRKRRRIGIGVGVGIIFLVLISFAWYFGIQYVKDTILGHPSKELLEGKWYQNKYGYPAISIETPVVLKATELPLPPEVTQQIISNSNFGYGSMLGGFYINISIMEFNPELQFNLDGAVEGAIQMIKAKKEVTDFKYRVDDVELQGNNGKKITGTLKVNGLEMNYVQYVINKENSLQQIVIVRKIKDTYAEKIEKRIIESIKINY